MSQNGAVGVIGAEETSKVKDAETKRANAPKTTRSDERRFDARSVKNEIAEEKRETVNPETVNGYYRSVQDLRRTPNAERRRREEERPSERRAKGRFAGRFGGCNAWVGNGCAVFGASAEKDEERRVNEKELREPKRALTAEDANQRENRRRKGRVGEPPRRGRRQNAERPRMERENAKRRRNKEFRRSLAEKFAVRASVQRESRRNPGDQKERKHQPRVNERRERVAEPGAVRREKTAETENMVPSEKDVINDDQNDRRAAEEVQVIGTRRKVNVGKGLRMGKVGARSHRRRLSSKGGVKEKTRRRNVDVSLHIVRGKSTLCNGNAEEISRKNDATKENGGKKRKTSNANSLKRVALDAKIANS